MKAFFKPKEMKYIITVSMLLIFISSCSVSAVNKKGQLRWVSPSRSYFSHHPKYYIGIAPINLKLK